jgi:ketosteroid isomerase-like protein
MSNTPVSDLDQLLIERACTRLVLDSFGHNDRRDFTAFAALFADDGELHRPSGAPLVGPAAIQAAYEARPATRMTRHVCTNVRVTVTSPATATGLTYVVLFGGTSTDAPDGHFGIKADARLLMGEVDDTFVLTPAGWRIRRRRAWFTFHT